MCTSPKTLSKNPLWKYLFISGAIVLLASSAPPGQNELRMKMKNASLRA